MISHHVAALAKVEDMQEILILGFFDESVFEGFLTSMRAEFPTITFAYLRETVSLGTGGGLYHFRYAIMAGNPERIFVLNGDIASSFPLAEMVSLQKKSVCTVVLTSKVDRENSNAYGCLVVDEATKVVVHFVEKPGN